MLNRREFVAGAAVWVFAAGGFPGTGRADDFGDGASAFIKEMGDKAIATLTEKNLSREVRVARFKELLDKYFALPVIGQWVLGPYWNLASAAQQSEYLGLFEKLVVATYVDRFAEYSGEVLSIQKAVTKERIDAMVHSEIIRSKGLPPLKVAWRVKAKQGEYRIVDVIVEGISMGQTQRSDFTSNIRSHGGDMAKFLSDLRRKLHPDA